MSGSILLIWACRYPPTQVPTILLEEAAFKTVWMKRSLATCRFESCYPESWSSEFACLVSCLRLIRSTCAGDTTIQLASQLGNWVPLESRFGAEC